MTRYLRIQTSVAMALALVALIGGELRGALPDQMPAGMLGGFKDLETWTRDVGVAPDTEYGLGLQLKGATGTINASFAAVKLRSVPKAPPKEVVVTMSPSFAVDPRQTLPLTLAFTITGKDKKQTTINVSNRMTAFPPGPYAPGDKAVSVQGRLTPTEFGQIAAAEILKTTVLSVQVTIRPDQLKALKALGERAGIVTK
jgi:hypothetical protein